jgi:peptide/nickel transport system permease protein
VISGADAARPTGLGGIPVVDPSAAHNPSRRATQFSFWFGVFIVAGFALLSFAAPLLPFQDPYAVDYQASLQSPSFAHLFGTDTLGRDMFSRVVYGSQVDLVLGFVTTYVSLILGMVAGAFAGYFRGLRETVVMRLSDTLISFPFLVLVLAIVAVVGPGLIGVYVGIVVVSWTVYARISYSEMLVLRERQFILAARTLGLSDSRVIFRHAIPNLLRPNLVFSVSDVVLNILALTALSYLGVGVKPPTPEWGALIASGQPYLLSAWWITTLPGLVVVVFGVGLIMLGEGVADRLSVDAVPQA